MKPCEHEHQRSEAVAVNDLTRKMAFGHAAGTTERVQWSLANQADAIDGPREEFDQHAAHTRSMADAHREEKIAMGERAAQQRRLAPEPALSLEQGRPSKRDRRALADWQRWSASADD